MGGGVLKPAARAWEHLQAAFPPGLGWKMQLALVAQIGRMERPQVFERDWEPPAGTF